LAVDVSTRDYKKKFDGGWRTHLRDKEFDFAGNSISSDRGAGIVRPERSFSSPVSA